MVEIFGLKLFGCSKCKKTRRHSRKKRRSYKGGYTYKHSGNNDAGEDVSNSPMVSSRKRSRSRRNMDDSVNSNSDSDMGKGKRSKRRRMY